MKRIFTKTFFRFLVAFMVILAISCGTMLLTTSVAAGRSQAAAVWGLLF